LETLLHALLECPAVRPALAWLAALWPAASGGGASPPLTPEVWLLASPAAAWQPRAPPHDLAATEALWTAMRLAVLAAAWRLRCRRCAVGQPFSAADVVDAALADLGRLLRAEFFATSDVVAVAGTSPEWFPRRRPPVPLAVFRAKWCRGGVLADAGVGPPPQRVQWLDVRLGRHALRGAARAAAVAAAGATAAGAAPAAGAAAAGSAPAGPGSAAAAGAAGAGAPGAGAAGAGASGAGAAGAGASGAGASGSRAGGV
jgi:hypothetical protein